MDMIVSTMNDLPGYTVDEALGANAVLALRFDSDEVGQGYQELVASGTVVRVTKV